MDGHEGVICEVGLLANEMPPFSLSSLTLLLDWFSGGGGRSPASYADTEIRTRLNALRKIKNANVAKTITARWLLKVVYHVLKEGRPYVAAHPAGTNRGHLSIALAGSQ
jgi:hypothetical protein